MLEKIDFDENFSLTITDHVEKRYAERIMNREEKYDITKYVLDHKDDIKKNIIKMVKYGTHIYSGKLRDFPYGNIFINKTGWCVICDREMKKAITLYKVDLGCSEELNVEYVREMTVDIIQLMENIDKTALERNNINSDIRKDMQSQKELVASLQKEINNVNNMIKAEELIIENNQFEVSELTRQYKNKVECLTCTKIF